MAGVALLAVLSLVPWGDPVGAETHLKAGEGFADLTGRGFSKVRVLGTGDLAPEETTRVSVTLSAGEDYLILGVCDRDCDDLDLTLFEDGEELVSDDTWNDWPLLLHTPSEGRTYEMEVLMNACEASVCGFEVSVWKK